MRKRVIVFEDSSKVGFGGGQNITLQTVDVLLEKNSLIFVDFSASSRYIKLVGQRFPLDKKIIMKSGVLNRLGSKVFEQINELLAFILFKNSNIQKLKNEVNFNDCTIYATTRRALIYSKTINRKFGVPYIYHAHLVEKKNGFRYKLIENALKSASSIICVSKAVQQSIPLNNTTLLYNPAPQNQLVKKKKLDNYFRVACIGSLIPIKGVEFFIKAAAIFKDHLNIEFLIYGEGEQHLELENMAGANVKMKGFCSNVIMELADRIDILVLSSVIEEALPTVIIEAKSLGIPVIATNIGGQAEIIEDGVDGFLVPVRDEKAIYDSINKLVCSRKTYNRMADASLKSAQRFSRVDFEKKMNSQFRLVQEDCN